MYVKILVFWDVMSCRLIIVTSISKNFIVFILQGQMGQDSPWSVLPWRWRHCNCLPAGTT